MIERRDPFSRMLSLRQMMDRLMEDAFVMPRDALMNGLSAMGAGGGMDVYEEGDSLIVEAQLPGYKPEDVDVSVERDTLTIRGEARAQEERKDRNYIVREQRSGTFQRSVQLPHTVDSDACQASFEHGVLRLTFPKAEQAKPRRIPIATGGGHGMESGSGMTGAKGAGTSQGTLGGQGTGMSQGTGGTLGLSSASQRGTTPGASGSGTAPSTDASRASASSSAAMGGAAGEDATPPGTGPGAAGGSDGPSGDGPSGDGPSGGQSRADSDASTDPSKR